ncbi:MAG: heme o synthase [Phycisphaerales bacterium]
MAVAPPAPSNSLGNAIPLPVSGLAPAGPVRVEVPAAAAPTSPATAGQTARAIVELGKPGITRLVTITALVGFVLAAVARPLAAWQQGGWGAITLTLAACVVGTVLSSGGANAINQWMERHRDALMKRTARRPLPQGRLTAGSALWAGLAMSIGGIVILAAFCGPAAAAVSLATILVYVLLYTPAKVLTPLNTILGAVPGALPPLIGWCAAQFPVLGWAHSFDALTQPGGWSLFALMFVWQIPHFLSLAWMYREDYAAGGYRMLPVVDADGSLTARTMLGWAIMLIPATLLPVLLLRGGAHIGWPYAAVAVLSGLAFIAVVVPFARSRQPLAARRVFLASIMHLPLLMVALVIEALTRWLLQAAA